MEPCFRKQEDIPPKPKAMKTLKNLIICSVISTSACGTGAQEPAVPDAVRAAFTQRFHIAQGVKWEEEDGGLLEATFVQDGKEHSANFTTSGAWVETEQRIKEKDLPEVVRAAGLTQYPGATVHKAERVSTPEHDLFEVELKTSSGKVEVMVTAEGAIVEDPRK